MKQDSTFVAIDGSKRTLVMGRALKSRGSTRTHLVLCAWRRTVQGGEPSQVPHSYEST
jgi:hypothetical protein